MKQFVISCIGSALGSMYLGFVDVLFYQMAGMGVFAIPGFIQTGGNTGAVLMHVGIALMISMGFSFVASYVTYKDEEKEESHHQEIEILSPVEGKVIQLSEMDDEAFSSEALGKGVCIIPTGNQIIAPISGEVTNLFPTLHAIGITSDEGVEVLIHIGMDTVNLNGKHFKAYVKQGDHVEVGQKLIEFDREEILKLNINLQTPVVITNTASLQDVQPCNDQDVVSGETLMKIIK